MSPARALGSVALAAVLALAALPVLAQSWGRAPDPAELARELEALSRDVDALRADVAAGGGAGAGTGGGLALRRLAEIEAELQRLTGEVERLGFRMDSIAADAERRFGDIEFRLTELEGGDVAALGASPPPLGGPDVAAGAAGPAISVSEQRALDDAIALVQRGQLDRATDALDDFIATYPDSPLIGDAHFWLGETYATRGEWRPAARSYLAGYRADRDGEAAPDNLVKLGVSLGQIDRVREAC
ncbi:MAG: tetratricopeptide repeat protein, partial [Pseudomonadota bacterium]